MPYQETLGCSFMGAQVEKLIFGHLTDHYNIGRAFEKEMICSLYSTQITYTNPRMSLFHPNPPCFAATWSGKLLTQDDLKTKPKLLEVSNFGILRAHQPFA